jgi:hypothetical protein
MRHHVIPILLLKVYNRIIHGCQGRDAFDAYRVPVFNFGLSMCKNPARFTAPKIFRFVSQ